MQKIFSLEMDDDQKEKGGLKSGGNTIMARPQTTSIVELKPLSKAEAQKYKDAESSKFEQFVKFLTSLFGECLARIFLLLLCGASMWRMIVSVTNTLPEVAYVFVSVGAFASLIDCGVSLYYYFHLPSYWKCYSYFHWKGRKWLDMNTLYCLLTICPAIFVTEYYIFNYQRENYIKQQQNNITTVAPSTNTYLQRDFTLFLLHNSLLILIPLLRLQVRSHEEVDRLSLNNYVHEMVLCCADLYNFVIEGIYHLSVVTKFDQVLFVTVFTIWSCGLFIPCLLVPDRCYRRLHATKWTKILDICHATLVVVVQDAARLTVRVVLIVMLITPQCCKYVPDWSSIVFWAGKNLICIFLYCHRVFSIAKEDS